MLKRNVAAWLKRPRRQAKERSLFRSPTFQRGWLVIAYSDALTICLPKKIEAPMKNMKIRKRNTRNLPT
jgi:hypothetical protein